MYRNILVPVVVVTLAAAFLDPFMVLMPESVVYGLLALLFITFVAYATLLWRETASDEREVMLRAFAGRAAYMAGSSVLVAGIIYQAHFLHHVDPFLVITLAVMIIAKYLGILLVEKN